jgi:O-antigen/teichoic acid export membrane protein
VQHSGRPRWLPAVHIRRIGLSVVDQGVTSAGNLAVTVIAARSLSVDDFGAFTIAYTVSVLALGATRSLTSEPMMIRFSNEDQPTARRAGSHSAGVAMLIGIAIGIGLAGVALFFSGSVRTALLIVAVGLPGLLLQDAWRFVCFSLGRPGVALINDSVWFAILLALTGVIRLATTPTIATIAATWVGTSAICAVIGAIQLRLLPAISHAWAWLRDHFDLASRFFLDYATAGGASYVTILVLGVVAGLPAAAAVRGVLTFFGPINVVFAGCSVALIPEGVRLAHRDRPRLGRFVRTLAMSLTGAAALWLVVGLVLPSRFGVAILGQTWDDARAVLPAMGLGLVAGGVTGAAFVGLRSLGDARRNLRSRMTSLPVLLVLPVGGALIADATGYAVGFALAATVAAVVWWRQFGISLRSIR